MRSSTVAVVAASVGASVDVAKIADASRLGVTVGSRRFARAVAEMNSALRMSQSSDIAFIRSSNQPSRPLYFAGRFKNADAGPAEPFEP